MATTIPDLWPKDIKVDVLPPIAILKTQEGLLSRRTEGMLQAKLTTTKTEHLVQHQLDLIAPALNFYRERLLSATHAIERVYPVTVTSEAFDPLPENSTESVGSLRQAFAPLIRTIHPSTIERRAATDDELIDLVGKVLQSEMVRSLIHSLIARINATNGQQTNGPPNPYENPPS